MANVTNLIDMIDVTKVCFVLATCGFWIFSVGLPTRLIWFTVYHSAKSLLDGTSLCAFEMCQGERRGPEAIFLSLVEMVLLPQMWFVIRLHTFLVSHEHRFKVFFLLLACHIEIEKCMKSFFIR